MKKKNLFFIPFFLLLMLLTSCPSEGVKTVRSIAIQQAIQKTVFYINDNNYTQRLTCVFYNQNGETISSKTVWSSNLPQNTVSMVSENNFSFDINSINELGDYYIQASSADNSSITTKYTFSLLSRNSLSDSLTYSFADVENSTLTINGNNIVNVKKIVEFDKSGNRISSVNQRMTLQDEINYFTSGTNFIYINFKQDKNLGKITSSFSDSSNLQAYITSDNGIIISGIVENDEDFVIKLSAGTKDRRNITIHAQSHNINIANPLVSEAVDSTLYDGKLLTITGDSVNTSYYPVDGGNNLEINIMRKRYDSSDEYEEYTDWKTNEETKEIKYGQTIHLKHAGDYVISARVVSATSESNTVTKTVSIAPYITDPSVLLLTTIIPAEIIENQNLWETLTVGSVVPQNNLYSVDITNPYTTGELIIYLTHILSSGQTEENTITLKEGESYSESFKESGHYYIEIKTSKALNGYGTVYDKDMVSSCCVFTQFEILEPQIEDEILTVTGSRTYKIDVSPNLPENAIVYVALLKDSIYDSTYVLSAGDQQIIENTDNKAYKIKAYAYFAYNRLSSILYEYTTEVPTLLASALPAVDTSDSVQDQNNNRRVKITATKDAYNNYRNVYYRWDESSQWLPVTLNNGVGSVYLSSKGSKTLYYQTEPTSSETVTGAVSSSITVTLSKLNMPYTSYVWGGLFNWGHTVKVGPGNNPSGTVCWYKWTGGDATSGSTTTSTITIWDGVGGSGALTAYSYKNGYITSDTFYVSETK